MGSLRRRALRRALIASTAALAGLGGVASPASAGICGVEVERGYVIEGDSGTSTLTLTVNATCAATVDYETRDGTATAGSDYVATSGTLVFEGSGSDTVEVEIVGDTTREWTESFFVDATSDEAATDPTGGRAEITDEDGASNVLVYDNEQVVDTSENTSAESDNVQASLAAMGHTVTLTEATTAEDLAAALEGKDAFVIPEEEEGSFVDEVEAAALDEIAAFVEAGGTLVKMYETETLNDIFGYELVESGGGDAEQLDTAAGTEFATNTDLLSNLDATNGVEASSVPDGTRPLYGYVGNGDLEAAALPAADATDLTAFLVPQGNGSVVWLGYDWFDSSPGFGEDLNPEGQNGGWSAVLDSSVEKPDLMIADASVVEGDSGTKTVNVAVSVSDSVSEVVTATATTAAGTATAGSDFVSSTSTVTIPRWTTTAVNVPVSIVNDNASEPTEAFTVALSDPIAARIVDGTGTVTIIDDDMFGYRLVASDGGVFTFGDNLFHGSLGNRTLNKPIVGGATNPVTTEGYWMVASDGGVFSFGDAGFFGSLGSTPITTPIVEIEPTITGKGYWLVAANGQVHVFGDAAHYGDARTIGLNQPVIGMSVAPDGKGYWLVAKDGGIFSFGSAEFFGSMGNRPLNQPVVDLAPMPDGKGYYLVAGDGGVFTFGSATFRGSMGGSPLNAPVVAMLVAADGSGYWLGAADGGVFTFGPVPFLGSMGGTKLNGPILDFIP